MAQILSALIWLMEENKWLPLLEYLRPLFNDFRSSRKKRMAKDSSLKPRKKAYSGSAPFTLPGFIRICSSAMVVPDAPRMFIWTFMVLAWNLCARSVNVAFLRWSSMSLEGDCIRIHFDCTKTMKGGEAEKHPKHIFSNPRQPEICSFLALGVLLLRNGVETDNDRMFSNKSGNQTFVLRDASCMGRVPYWLYYGTRPASYF